MAVENHVTASEALESAAARLTLSADEQDEVHFLIEHHLVCRYGAAARHFRSRHRLCVCATVGIRAAATPLPADLRGHPAVTPRHDPVESGDAVATLVATSNHFSDSGYRSLARTDEGRSWNRCAAYAGASTEEIERFSKDFLGAIWRCTPRRRLPRISLCTKNLLAAVQTELHVHRHAFSLTC